MDDRARVVEAHHLGKEEVVGGAGNADGKAGEEGNDHLQDHHGGGGLDEEEDKCSQ